MAEMQLEEGKQIKLELSPDESQRYWDWVNSLSKVVADNGEQLEDMTISFIFTPYGQEVIAHTGGNHPSQFGHSIVLADDSEI